MTCCSYLVKDLVKQLTKTIRSKTPAVECSSTVVYCSSRKIYHQEVSTQLSVKDSHFKYFILYVLSMQVSSTPDSDYVSIHNVSILQAHFQSGFHLLLPLCDHHGNSGDDSRYVI